MEEHDLLTFLPTPLWDNKEIKSFPATQMAEVGPGSILLAILLKKLPAILLNNQQYC